MNRNLIFVWVICCAIYLALTPWRHPYFNTPVFCSLTLAGMLFSIFLERKKLGDWSGILYAAVAVHIATVVAALVIWLSESATGVEKVLSHFGLADLLAQTILFPFFSYAVPVVLLVTACNKMLIHRPVVEDRPQE